MLNTFYCIIFVFFLFSFTSYVVYGQENNNTQSGIDTSLTFASHVTTNDTTTIEKAVNITTTSANASSMQNTSSLSPLNTANHVVDDYVFLKNYDIAVAGDWGCNNNTRLVVNYIKTSNPELVVTPGDLSYEETGECFYNVTKPIISKLKIAFGNHDNEVDESFELREEYMSYFNLTRPFYSFDHNNSHFLMMDSSIAPSKLSAQYYFVQEDLEKASNNSDTKWIFVLIHKPLYSSQGKHPPDIQTAYIYHPLFDKYNVDIVISGHNHWYERTLPVKFNNIDPINPIISIPKGNDVYEIVPNSVSTNKTILDFYLNSTFNNPDNPIFITVGTGGHKLYEIDKSNIPKYITKTYDDGFGFLGINVTNNQLLGEYHGTQLKGSENNFESHHYYTKDLFRIVK